MANMAGSANARGGMASTGPNAAHMDTTAYGLQAARKPTQTATLSWEKPEENKNNTWKPCQPWPALNPLESISLTPLNHQTDALLILYLATAKVIAVSVKRFPSAVVLFI